jgi:hypothetical protein
MYNNMSQYCKIIRLRMEILGWIDLGADY